MSNLILNPVDQIIKSPKMKETYGFISTAELINQLSLKGWQPSNISIAQVRNEDKRGYQKHLIRLQNPEFDVVNLQGDLVRPELVVLNSHDGSTSTRLYFGVLRIACLNGMIAGSTFKEIKIIHSKNFTNKLDNGIEYITSGIPDLIRTIETLSRLTFSNAAQNEFVKSCVDYKLRNIKNIVDVNYSSALEIRRIDDVNTDVWTVLSRVQEAIIRGGIRYSFEAPAFEYDFKTKAKTEIGTRIVTRNTSAIKSISQNVELNKMIFNKAMEIAA